MELDDNFKHLIKELGDAINESLSESDTISDVLARIRASGYDLFLVLEVTIGFNKKGEGNLIHRQKLGENSRKQPLLRLTTQDAQFLKALRISVEKSES